ncbi:MAG: cobyric acid synthase, partial [Clostridiales bacterium]|nr:cobyric acid synthase [Clostridiales bacterium]
FKSQNMALNSYITKEGLEMGRAQVMQAEAAGAEPSVRMNPILLKPTSDTGSQVIVGGEVVGVMSARDYFQYKKKLVPDIRKAYDSLAAEYDIIVIEGAGSPAEINLKSDDIVNMGMAKLADAPVLLVGDIDRGGVFAQLVGTMELLEPEERERVCGLIINKFRGDQTILDPGIETLENLCGTKVVGVVPYMDVDLEDEDSLSARMEERREAKLIDIAVIRFPRISNFTDFNIFESIDGVSVRYVRHPAQLKTPDMIILPGTKSTMADLRWMRQSGMEAAVLKAKEKDTVIFGVCGGYQMLGQMFRDPDGVEDGGSLRGMGLLPTETVFEREKTRTRVEGRFEKIGGALAGLSGAAVSGYEIHMGRSVEIDETGQGTTGMENDSRAARMTRIRDSVTGTEKTEGMNCENVYGTYIHGIFDREETARTVVQALAARRGIDLSDLEATDYAAYKEAQYDKLAGILRRHLDMERIYGILGYTRL